MKSSLTLLGIFIILSLSNCSSNNTKVSTKPLPLVQKELSEASSGSATHLQSTDTLTLNLAINWALENNPRIQAAFLNIQAQEARAAQESKLSNPELGVEIENFAGSGPLSGFQSSETTISVGQLIELGNKRQLRTEIANSMSRQAALEYEVMRLQIITEVRQTYTRLSAAQSRLELTGKLLKLSERFKGTVDTLVIAGRYSPAESARSEVEYQNVRIRRFQAERVLNQSRQELAALWGGSDREIGIVESTMDIHTPLPAKEATHQAIQSSPRVILAELEVKTRAAETDLATKLWIPDPTISTGFRKINETGDRALVAGISIPLPVLNRNKGGIEAARLRQKQSEQLRYSEEIAVLQSINTKFEMLKSLEMMIETLSGMIIPEAERAYDIINQNYRLGQYGLIDVIDSQRQLFDAQLEYLDTHLEYDNNIIQLEGLLGRSITSF